MRRSRAGVPPAISPGRGRRDKKMIDSLNGYAVYAAAGLIVGLVWAVGAAIRAGRGRRLRQRKNL
jgi:hypothetical protein